MAGPRVATFGGCGWAFANSGTINTDSRNAVAIAFFIFSVN
jgi:hypothetical protein